MRERRGMGTDGSALRGLWWGLWIEAVMIAVGLMIWGVILLSRVVEHP